MNEKDSLLRELDRAKEEQLAYDGGAPMHERLTGAAGLLHQSMRSSGMGVGSGSGGMREAGTSMSRAAIDFTRTAVHEATARFEDEIKVLALDQVHCTRYNCIPYNRSIESMPSMFWPHEPQLDFSTS